MCIARRSSNGAYLRYLNVDCLPFFGQKLSMNTDIPHFAKYLSVLLLIYISKSFLEYEYSAVLLSGSERT
ncbi:unnamed protein product [Ixodes persulcatus]